MLLTPKFHRWLPPPSCCLSRQHSVIIITRTVIIAITVPSFFLLSFIWGPGSGGEPLPLCGDQPVSGVRSPAGVRLPAQHPGGNGRAVRGGGGSRRNQPYMNKLQPEIPKTQKPVELKTQKPKNPKFQKPKFPKSPKFQKPKFPKSPKTKNANSFKT